MSCMREKEDSRDQLKEIRGNRDSMSSKNVRVIPSEQQEMGFKRMQRWWEESEQKDATAGVGINVWVNKQEKQDMKKRVWENNIRGREAYYSQEEYTQSERDQHENVNETLLLLISVCIRQETRGVKAILTQTDRQRYNKVE